MKTTNWKLLIEEVAKELGVLETAVISVNSITIDDRGKDGRAQVDVTKGKTPGNLLTTVNQKGTVSILPGGKLKKVLETLFPQKSSPVGAHSAPIAPINTPAITGKAEKKDKDRRAARVEVSRYAKPTKIEEAEETGTLEDANNNGPVIASDETLVGNTFGSMISASVLMTQPENEKQATALRNIAMQFGEDYHNMSQSQESDVLDDYRKYVVPAVDCGVLKFALIIFDNSEGAPSIQGLNWLESNSKKFLGGKSGNNSKTFAHCLATGHLLGLVENRKESPPLRWVINRYDGSWRGKPSHSLTQVSNAGLKWGGKPWLIDGGTGVKVASLPGAGVSRTLDVLEVKGHKDKTGEGPKIIAVHLAGFISLLGSYAHMRRIRDAVQADFLAVSPDLAKNYSSPKPISTHSDWSQQIDDSPYCKSLLRLLPREKLERLAKTESHKSSISKIIDSPTKLRSYSAGEANDFRYTAVISKVGSCSAAGDVTSYSDLGTATSFRVLDAIL